MRKKQIFLLLLIISLLGSNIVVKAFDGRKDEYIYSYWNQPIPSAPGLALRQTIDEGYLGVGLNKPSDIFAFDDKLYMIDMGTNHLYVLNDVFQVEQHIQYFPYEQPINGLGEVCTPTEDNVHLQVDTALVEPNPDHCYIGTGLKEPEGINVTDEAIYIADTGHGRIVKITHDFKFIESFGKPDDPTFTERNFVPIKIAVDRTNRMYVIARTIHEGIIELNDDGSFNRFVGVNPVTVTIIDIIRRQFATEEQLSKMQLFLPTSFTNLIIDERGFIYATALPSQASDNTSMIKLINPKGEDVLKRTGYFPPAGDIVYYRVGDGRAERGPSSLVDIAISSHGIYTVLDQKRSRLFTYDDEGRLLYITNDEGQLQGKDPLLVALTYFNDQMVVLDQGSRSIKVFQPTDFGELVNRAVSLHHEGKFEESAEVWGEVARLNSNYEIAYIGIGKSLLRQQKYREAMRNFKLGNDRYYYSKAFEGFRKELIDKNFTWIMTIFSIGGLVLLAKPIMSFFKEEKEE